MEEIVESRKTSLEDLAERVLRAYLDRMVSVCNKMCADDMKKYIGMHEAVLSLVQGVRDLEDEGYESDDDAEF